jgi:hypothetical protein
LLKILITCGLLVVAPLATADSLILDGIDFARASEHMRPVRGTSMESVHYGTPTSQQAAVGGPPIARWNYADFVVYFEYDLVIHAVVTP